MAVILKAMPFGSSGRERQNRIEPIQGLDSAFLVDAENSGIGRRLEVKADDVGGLLFKLWIITDHVAAQTMGLQTDAPPSPVHSIVTNAQRFAQLARAPVGGTISRAAARIIKNASLQLGCVLGRLSSLVACVKTSDALLQKAAFPPHNIILAARQSVHDLAIGLAASQSKNKPGAFGIVGPATSSPRAASQFPAFRWRQHNP